MIAHFLDIGGIVDHHCLKFLLIIIKKHNFLQVNVNQALKSQCFFKKYFHIWFVSDHFPGLVQAFQ